MIKSVPKIEGLRVPDLIKFANGKWDIQSYLPILSKNMMSDRKWLVNVGRLMVNNDHSQYFDTRRFHGLVKEALDKRQQKYEKEKGIQMNIKKEFIELFQNTSSTSSK